MEINLNEYLNHNLKQNIHGGIILHAKEQIHNKTENKNAIQCDKKICAYPGNIEKCYPKDTVLIFMTVRILEISRSILESFV